MKTSYPARDLVGGGTLGLSLGVINNDRKSAFVSLNKIFYVHHVGKVT